VKSSPFIGVDVSQRTLDIARTDRDQALRIDHTLQAIRAWLKELPQHCRIGVESTGNLHRLLVRCAIAAGHTVYVLNARDLSHYARALGRRAKTDRLDAALIARYLAREHEHLHPHRLPSALQEQLDELISRRRSVVVMQGALRQSFASVRNKPRALAPTLRQLQQLLAQIDQQLAQLTAADPQLGPIAQRLRTVVGFGPLLSTALAHALTRHPFVHADAFIAYIGYDPRVRDSGKKCGRRRLSKRGPAELRRLLFTAALSACKTALWRPFYQRYRDRGLSTTAALVILARKLARIAFSMAKRSTEFNPQLIQTPCACP
jgi:transposase